MKFPTPFTFGYAVDASWAPPDVIPVEDPQNDFPPEANCPEPWRIDVTVEGIDQGLTDMGGQAKLLIDVYDHQGPGSINSVKTECFDLWDGWVTAVEVISNPQFTRYEATVENIKLAGIGEYRCLVAAEDTENATSPDWLDLTGYQVITLIVSEFIPQSYPPVAIASAEPLEQFTFADIHFFDDGSFDPDGGD